MNTPVNNEFEKGNTVADDGTLEAANENTVPGEPLHAEAPQGAPMNDEFLWGKDGMKTNPGKLTHSGASLSTVPPDPYDPSSPNYMPPAEPFAKGGTQPGGPLPTTQFDVGLDAMGVQITPELIADRAKQVLKEAESDADKVVEKMGEIGEDAMKVVGPEVASIAKKLASEIAPLLGGVVGVAIGLGTLWGIFGDTKPAVVDPSPIDPTPVIPAPTATATATAPKPELDLEQTLYNIEARRLQNRLNDPEIGKIINNQLLDEIAEAKQNTAFSFLDYKTKTVMAPEKCAVPKLYIPGERKEFDRAESRFVFTTGDSNKKFTLAKWYSIYRFGYIADDNKHQLYIRIGERPEHLAFTECNLKSKGHCYLEKNYSTYTELARVTYNFDRGSKSVSDLKWYSQIGDMAHGDKIVTASVCQADVDAPGEVKGNTFMYNEEEVARNIAKLEEIIRKSGGVEAKE